MRTILLGLFARPLTSVQWYACCLWGVAPAIVVLTLRSLWGNHFLPPGVFLAMAGAHAVLTGAWVAAHVPAAWSSRMLSGLLVTGIFFAMNFVPLVEGLGCCGTTR